MLDASTLIISRYFSYNGLFVLFLFVWLFFNSSPESDQMVKDKCNGKNFCEVEASNEVFGNPCGETHKYLEVQYHCQAGKEISKTN